MAIKVQGTTVVDDSRNILNVVDANVTGVSTFQGNVNVGTGATIAFFDVSTGNIGIGSTQPTATLDVNGNLNVSGITTASRFVSTQLTGTAPLTVSSTTLVSNLNADLLDGQEGSYYTDASNINAGTINDAYLPATISSDITGNAATATTATDATNVTVADESTDTTCFPLFVTAATGNLPPKSGTNLTFNSSTGILGATTFSGSGASLTSLNASNISTGTLAIARGGTNGSATPTLGGAAYGTGTAYAFTAAGSAGQVLTSNGAAAPTWQDAAGGGGGAGGKWIDAGVGIVTTSSIGVNTTTVVGTANSEGAIQAVGNVALVDGALLTDQNIDANVYIPSGKNGLMIGPTTVGVGVTIDIASGSTLVVV